MGNPNEAPRWPSIKLTKRGFLAVGSLAGSLITLPILAACQPRESTENIAKEVTTLAQQLEAVQPPPTEVPKREIAAPPTSTVRLVESSPTVNLVKTVEAQKTEIAILRKAPELTKVPTQVVPKSNIIIKPTEATPKKEFITFVSKNLDYPYQIEYPNGWKYSPDQLSDQSKQDVFTSNETIEGRTTYLRIYALKAIASAYDDAKGSIENMKQQIRQGNKDLDPEKLISVPQTRKIDGEEGWAFTANIPKGAFGPNSATYYSLFVLFSKKGLIWFIECDSHPTVFNKNLPTFNKMLDSIKIL